jgi:hypothetical protein
MNFRFIFTPKPKKYNYKPQFYKPEEEEEGLSKFTPSPNPNSPIRRGMFTSRYAKRHQKSTYNLLWLIILTLLLLYLIFMT